MRYDYEYWTSGNKTSTQLEYYTIRTGSDIYDYGYIYDANGNIIAIDSNDGMITYHYDNLNQLVRVNDAIARKTWTYSYDFGGNILNKSEYSYTQASTPSENLLISSIDYTYSEGAWGDLLVGITDGVTSKTITSDNIGNMLSDGTWSYTWQHGRQLASMTNGSTTVSYGYDASGMRTSKTVGNKTWQYVYNGSTLSYMTDGDNDLFFSYDSNGPMSVSYNDTVYYYVQNAQGDVIALVNSNGAEVVTYSYDSWGKLMSVGGSMANTLGQHNPMRYRGYVYDTETGLYYLQSRYYNPALCRFICADGMASTGQDILGYNMFIYCLNNPVTRYDPTGNFSYEIIAAKVVGKLPNPEGYTVEDVIKAQKEGTPLELHNPDWLIKSENDQVKVTLTYFQPGIVDHIGVDGAGWVASMVGGATMVATSKIGARVISANFIPLINIIAWSSSIYAIVDGGVDHIYVKGVKQEAKDNGIGVVLVEEEWTVYDGQHWEFKKSYFIFWDEE